MQDENTKADSALAALSRGVRGVRWPDAVAIKRAARRRTIRRRARWGAWIGSLTAAAAVVSSLVVAGGKTAAKVSVAARSGTAVQLMAQISAAPTPDPTAQAAVAQAEQEFSLYLLDQVSAGGQNVTVSPLSLSIALAMLENGAHGETLSQIEATLRTPSMDPTVQDHGWASLISVLTADSHAGGITLHSADSLWLQNGLPMQGAFMTAMARYYATGVWQVNFAGNLPAASDAIDNWVKQNTAGKITKLFAPGDIDPNTLLVLANAVYLDAPWQTPFQAFRSEPSPFQVTSTETTFPTFMHGFASRTATTATYQLAEIPYAGGKYVADAIMPSAGALTAFTSGLTAASLESMTATATTPSAIALPRFTTQNYINLNQTLKNMGMPIAFTPAADFSAMSPQGLQLQSAVQRDYLSVTETGTIAAAATGISAIPTSAEVAGPELRFNHPFLFLIRDTTSGAILFTSLVQNPTST